MYKAIHACRICGNRDLVDVLDLGEQTLTGVFPRNRMDRITSGPLRLALCSGGDSVCGLLQLRHSYELGEMYGDNYGYRSGLNASMVAHLRGKVNRLRELLNLRDGDLVVDIGSNDGTTLSAYPAGRFELVGVDPTGAKFEPFYPPGVKLIPDFFSAQKIREYLPGRCARVVTSFSMFYDLEDPLEFMRQVHAVLEEDGIWVFEQSYMPAMLKMTSYDTACHEHLEYYGLRQIKWLTDRAGFRIIEVTFNEVNGGSFSVTVAKGSGTELASDAAVQSVLDAERRLGLHTIEPYRAFAQAAEKSRAELVDFLRGARDAGEKVCALGASTKGNVLLQYCGVTPDLIACVGEINSDKFGSFTPGTGLPIVPEDEMLAKRPDYLLVLPWHFREHFLQSPKLRGVHLVFPLPKLEVVRVQ